MLNRSLLILVTLCFAASAFAFGTPPKESPTGISSSLSVIIDNFEDGSISSDPEWWSFDQVMLSSSHNPAKGALSLSVKGKASDWYVGGMGTYIAKEEQDFSSFGSLEIDVYGFGPDSGKIKIELLEDDNGNWQIEQDPKKSFLPVFDDRFTYELVVDWIGWRPV